MGATSLFAGARLPGWQAYLVPLVLMAITDPIRATFYGVQWYTKYQLFIYGSFLIGVWLGRWLRATESMPRIAAVTVLNSTQFFPLTDFAAWSPVSKPDPRTARGISELLRRCDFLSSAGRSPATSLARLFCSACTLGQPDHRRTGTRRDRRVGVSPSLEQRQTECLDLAPAAGKIPRIELGCPRSPPSTKPSTVSPCTPSGANWSNARPNPPGPAARTCSLPWPCSNLDYEGSDA